MFSVCSRPENVSGARFVNRPESPYIEGMPDFEHAPDDIQILIDYARQRFEEGSASNFRKCWQKES